MQNATALYSQASAYLVPKQWSAPLDNSLQFINWPWCSMVWNNSLASLYQVLWLCSVSAFLCSSSLEEHNPLKIPWLYPNTVQEQLKHECVINTVLMINPKHSTTAATRKNMSHLKPGLNKPVWHKSCQIVIVKKMKLFLTLLWTSRLL